MSAFVSHFEELKNYCADDKHVYSIAEMSDDATYAEDFRRAVGPHKCYSISKSVTGCAVGILEAEGKLKVTDTVYSHIGDLFPEGFDPRWREVTLHDVMLHRTGVGPEGNIDVDTMDFWSEGREDFLKFFLSRPIVYDPGNGPFTYCDTNYYLIGRVVERVCGMTCAEFLQLRMFNPLRWRGNTWGTCPQNHTLGGSGLTASARDMCAYGYMLACGGEYHGERILTSDYIERARGPVGGYGYGFSNHDDGRWFATYGMFGQGVYIFPEKRAAFVAMGCLVDTEAIRRDIVPLYLN